MERPLFLWKCDDANVLVYVRGCWNELYECKCLLLFHQFHSAYLTIVHQL